jgi:hypothetical protein
VTSGRNAFRTAVLHGAKGSGSNSHHRSLELLEERRAKGSQVTGSSGSTSTSTPGVDGFVVNLDHHDPGLEERVSRFAEEVVPLIRR